jgi:hypothetical protein
MEFSLEQIETAFNSLPEELQNIIGSVETADTIMKIGKKHHLHIDHISELAQEIGLVMMGLVKPQDFTMRIEKRLLLPTKDAVAITMDVNNEIFFKIQNFLRDITEKTERGESHYEEQQPIDKSKLTSNIFEKKMSGLFTQSAQKNEQKTFDPYREPID